MAKGGREVTEGCGVTRSTGVTWGDTGHRSGRRVAEGRGGGRGVTWGTEVTKRAQVWQRGDVGVKWGGTEVTKGVGMAGGDVGVIEDDDGDVGHNGGRGVTEGVTEE